MDNDLIQAWLARDAADHAELKAAIAAVQQDVAVIRAELAGFKVRLAALYAGAATVVSALVALGVSYVAG